MFHLVWHQNNFLLSLFSLKLQKRFQEKCSNFYFFFPVQFFLQETDWKKIQEEKTACEFFSISKNTVETFSHKKIPDEEQKGKKVQIFSHEKSFLQEMFEKKHILMFSFTREKRQLLRNSPQKIYFYLVLYKYISWISYKNFMFFSFFL